MKILRSLVLIGPLMFYAILLAAQSPSSYIIQLTTDTNPDIVRQFFSEKHINIQFREIAPSIRAWELIPESDPTRKASDWTVLLAQCPGISAYQPNRRLERRRKTPNDPKFSEQWYLEVIKMPEAWEITTGTISSTDLQPVIGVLEAGYDFTRTDLQGLLFQNPGEIPGNGIDDDNNGYVDDVHGWNFDSGDDDHYIDYTYHGDAVVSIMAARTNNQVGIAGINWSGQVLPLTLEARNTEAATIEAYEYFYQMRKRFNETDGAQGAFIVATNSSFGLDGLFEEDAPLFCEMFNKMGSVGILSVGATSNQDVNVDIHGDLPSSCSSDQLIVVNSIDRDLMNNYSGRGPVNVDLAAPAQNILVVAEPGEFIDDSGTSFAAPQISGVISLAYSLELDSLHAAIAEDPVLVADHIRTCILENTTAAPDLADENASGGYLNALASLQCVYDAYHVPESDEAIAVINLYPNASQDILNIDYLVQNLQEKVHLVIYDMMGKKVKEATIDPILHNPAQINVGNLAPGIYALSLIQNNHTTAKQFAKF